MHSVVGGQYNGGKFTFKDTKIEDSTFNNCIVVCEDFVAVERCRLNNTTVYVTGQHVSFTNVISSGGNGFAMSLPPIDTVDAAYEAGYRTGKSGIRGPFKLGVGLDLEEAFKLGELDGRGDRAP